MMKTGEQLVEEGIGLLLRGAMKIQHEEQDLQRAINNIEIARAMINDLHNNLWAQLPKKE